MKDITVKDYEKVSGEFFAKYHYVAKELGENAEPEQILKIMEALGALVMKKRSDENVPFGFKKEEGEEE